MKKFALAAFVVIGGAAFAAFQSNAGEKIIVCHQNNGINEEVLIEVSTNALDTHLAHGDQIGTCGSIMPDPQ